MKNFESFLAPQLNEYLDLPQKPGIQVKMIEIPSMSLIDTSEEQTHNRDIADTLLLS